MPARPLPLGVVLDRRRRAVLLRVELVQDRSPEASREWLVPDRCAGFTSEDSVEAVCKKSSLRRFAAGFPPFKGYVSSASSHEDFFCGARRETHASTDAMSIKRLASHNAPRTPGRAMAHDPTAISLSKSTSKSKLKPSDKNPPKIDEKSEKKRRKTQFL